MRNHRLQHHGLDWSIWYWGNCLSALARSSWTTPDRLMRQGTVTLTLRSTHWWHHTIVEEIVTQKFGCSDFQLTIDSNVHMRCWGWLECFWVTTSWVIMHPGPAKQHQRAGFFNITAYSWSLGIYFVMKGCLMSLPLKMKWLWRHEPTCPGTLHDPTNKAFSGL